MTSSPGVLGGTGWPSASTTVRCTPGIADPRVGSSAIPHPGSAGSTLPEVDTTAASERP